jgi:hypothetical protein
MHCPSWLSVCLLALSVSACGRDSSPLTPSGTSALNVADLATSASTSDASGVLRDGAPPAERGGPPITVSGNQTVINGGTMAVNVQSASPMSKLFVYITARTLGLVTDSQSPIGSYFEVTLPALQASTTVLLTFPQEIPLREFDVRFAAADASGAVGPSAGLSTTVALVGTGDVQVTLSWDVDSDVDLHVIDPSGEEIFYANRQAASRGELDLDSNAACDIDGVRNENITWPVGRAPVGRYTVRVDYWDSCGVARTNYTVRVNAGGTPQITTGTFTGSGDQGGVGSGRTVATFQRNATTTGSLTFDVVPGESEPAAVTKGIKPRGTQR